MLIVKMPSIVGSTKVYNVSCCNKVEALIGAQGTVIGLKLLHFGAETLTGGTYEESINFSEENSQVSEAYVENINGRTVAHYFSGQPAGGING